MKLKLWSPSEQFLVIEVAPRRTSGLLLSLDEEKVLRLKRFWEHLSKERIFRKIPLGVGKRTIIASADPSLAFTTFVPVRLERGARTAKEPLELLELENLLAQSIGKVFSQCRRQASQFLGIEELDTILVGSRVTHFKVDGHKVMNPVGFHGRRIEVVLELTLTTRQIFDEWKSLFNTKEGVFFTESARAALVALEKLGHPPINLMTVRPGNVSCFILEPAAVGTVIYRGALSWDVRKLLTTIVEALGTSEAVSAALYGEYCAGRLSSPGARWMERLLRPVLDSLFKEVERTRMRGRVYLDSLPELPFELPKRAGKVVFEAFPVEELLGQLGFQANFSRWRIPERDRFKYLAPFIEFYYDKSDSPINHRLWRRLHWLGSGESFKG